MEHLFCYWGKKDMWEREIDEMIVLSFRWILTGYRNGQTGTLWSSIMGNDEFYP